MEAFLQFFETIPPSYRTVLLASGLLIFWVWEGAVPLFKFSYRRYRHLGLNLVFTLTTLIVNFSLAFLIVKAADFVQDAGFGIWFMWDVPLWINVLVGVLVLDLIGAWLVHLVEHKVKWMWKFHLIHHTDTTVDVTTALRHHPGESIFRAAFTVFAVLISGAPIALVFVYQTASALFSQFNHANINFPQGLDRFLSYIVVTPHMHKVHHHFTQPLTDTNYGNIFAFWDRIFQTFAEVDHPSKLTYGIDTHMEAAENDNLANLMAIPFQVYRAPQGSKFASQEEANTPPPADKA
ncbi:MAG: sterol desaturase family protein [Bacteroidetes bacterium]|nr:sterol desaturase family protein [Bacteroidota bacterium]